MRTVIAMLFAIVSAAVVTFSISQNVADNVVATTHIESPDQAANMHAAAFLGTGLLALVLGYGAGYVLGWPFRRKPPAV